MKIEILKGYEFYLFLAYFCKLICLHHKEILQGLISFTNLVKILFGILLWLELHANLLLRQYLQKSIKTIQRGRNLANKFKDLYIRIVRTLSATSKYVVARVLPQTDLAEAGIK